MFEPPHPCDGERDAKIPQPHATTTNKASHKQSKKTKKIIKQENLGFIGKTRLFPHDHGKTRGFDINPTKI